MVERHLTKYREFVRSLGESQLCIPKQRNIILTYSGHEP